MEHVEIERRFLVRKIPSDLGRFRKRVIGQGYLCVTPTVRVRRDNDDYYLTYKNGSGLAHTEYNLPLTSESYEHLIAKADGICIRKDRYEIPDGTLTIELDIFHGELEGLSWAEVEFPSTEAAEAYKKPAWFGKEVTGIYTNAALSRMIPGQAAAFVRKVMSGTSES